MALDIGTKRIGIALSDYLLMLANGHSYIPREPEENALESIKKIAKEQGKTFILSSHNPNHALYLSSNVFLLRSGTIVAQGQAEDIINIEELKTVYGEDICYSVELPYKEISFMD